MFLKTQKKIKICSREQWRPKNDTFFVSNEQFAVVLAEIQIKQHGKIQ